MIKRETLTLAKGELKQNNVLHFRQRDDDYHGLCPKCHREPRITNTPENHFAICEEHKFCWYLGVGIYPGCDESDESRLSNRYHLEDDYKLVEAFYWPIYEKSEVA